MIGPLTGWGRGDRVEVTAAYNDVAKGAVPVGTTGYLQDMYRVQDGMEVWSFWAAPDMKPKSNFGPRLLAGGSSNLKRIAVAKSTELC